MEKSLFNLVVPPEKEHVDFKSIRTHPSGEPTRRMLDFVFEDFVDPDGNFLEQLQSQGFNSRLFEMYLYAYFKYSGYGIDRTNANPDFIVDVDGLRIAVEATTVNPSTSGVLSSHGATAAKVTDEQLSEFIKNELPIRLGSALTSKLNKKYWHLEHCANLPFVLAIEDFHSEKSLTFSENTISRYLYGVEQEASWDDWGITDIEQRSIENHVIGPKQIPSNFFALLGAENISAVIFTNSGTSAKFSRMGYQQGYGNDTLWMNRSGLCVDPEHFAREPQLFQYSLAHPPMVEDWGQGLWVFHNPACKHPLSTHVFRNTTDYRNENGKIIAYHSGWQPITSSTHKLVYSDSEKSVSHVSFANFHATYRVSTIPKDFAESQIGNIVAKIAPMEARGWYGDDSNAFIGVICENPADSSWAVMIFARDEYFNFYEIDSHSDFSNRNTAWINLILKIREYLSQPQRVFQRLSEE